MSGIKVDHLSHAYNAKKAPVVVVDDLNLDIAENEFFTLLGPSGCGKTTTLRCIAGLESPTNGTITLGGVEVVNDRRVIPTHKRDIGMVFQDYAIWPHMSVFDNVAFPLRLSRRTGKAEIDRRVREALELVNMSQFIDRRATQLSGGQQQRLSLARALVRNPSVLLLDEPLSNLDAKLRERMREELRGIQQRIGITTLFVTHDQVEALSLSTRIAVMNHGKVEQIATPRELYLSPASEFVARFVGSTNLLRGKVVDRTAESIIVDTEAGQLNCAHGGTGEDDSDVLVAIRPESLTISNERASGANSFPVTVDLGLFVGEAVDYRVLPGHGRDALGTAPVLRARGDARREFTAGEQVYATVAVRDCVLLNAGRGGAADELIHAVA
jgi:iron(III) transport system ATP-binding protein